MKNILYLVLGLSLIFSCTEDTSLEPAETMLVVQAYLYAGEPISDIQITETLPLGSEDEKAPPVNDASVYLIKNNVTFKLVNSPGDSGYYHYDGNDLQVSSGDHFELVIEKQGDKITAETSVPAPPESLTSSSTILVVPEQFTRIDPYDSTRFINLAWKEEADALFFVVIECVEEKSAEIETFGGEFSGRRFVFPPTNNNEFRISRKQVGYYGKHIATVYRVNQEYADLYESRDQDSRDLNEPLTNIKNGLGVFSAFASQTVEFTVVPE